MTRRRLSPCRSWSRRSIGGGLAVLATVCGVTTTSLNNDSSSTPTGTVEAAAVDPAVVTDTALEPVARAGRLRPAPTSSVVVAPPVATTPAATSASRPAATKPAAAAPVTSTVSAPATSAPAAAPVTAAPAADTGSAPVGNLPGWNQVYVDDFTKTAGVNQVGSVYPRLVPYPDGSGDGKYQTDNLTVNGGTLNLRLQNVNGQGQGSAFTITSPTSGWGQKYGRYSIRFRADEVDGFGSAMMLMPDKWSDGETDFPEGEFSSSINIYNHQVGNNPAVNSLAVNTGARWSDWHVATIDWTPSAMTFYFDGKQVGTDTKAVSQASRAWIVQAAEHSAGGASNMTGSLQVDWVALYTYAG